MIIVLKNIKPIEKKGVFISKKLFLLSIFLLFFTDSLLFSQAWWNMKYEITGSVSANSLFSDIGGASSSLSMTRPGVSFGLRYKIDPRWSVRSDFEYNMFAATDQGSKNDTRSLSVSTSAIAFGGQCEYSIIQEDNAKRKRLSFSEGLVNSIGLYNLYVLAGFRIMSYSPVLSNPKNLHIAENETITGRGIALIMPIGVGFKYFINNRFSLTTEFLACFSSSDYLDGYSSKVYSKANDFFYQFKFGCAYKLYTGKNGLPSFKPHR